MKIKNKVIKYLCCCNLKLGARLIGFVGIAMSTALVSVLLRDKSGSDFNASRRMALVLGLDWQHFHPSANATHAADPDGRMISIIVLFYAILYVVTSASLIVATIIRKRWLTIPWLSCEMLGCLSKIAALIFHGIYARKRYDNGFIIGSIMYIVIMTWWWMIVFAAQMTWKEHRKSVPAPVVTYVRADSNTFDARLYELKINNLPSEIQDKRATLDSPAPYDPSRTYTLI